MAEPEENTYVITVVLRGVSKKDALKTAGWVRWAASFVTDNVEVFTAHLKDEA
jgi:hypothetical protein